MRALKRSGKVGDGEKEVRRRVGFEGLLCVVGCVVADGGQILRMREEARGGGKGKGKGKLGEVVDEEDNED